MRPLGSAGRTLAGTAGALLAPGLFAAAGNLSAAQGALGALALVGKLCNDDLVHDRLIHRNCKDAVGQLDLADIGALHVRQCNLRHIMRILLMLALTP